MAEFLTVIFDSLRSDATGTRSNAMRGMTWLVGLLVGGVMFSSVGEHPAAAWVTIVLAVFAGLGVVAFIGLHTYFAVRKPDMLRSERFVIKREERGRAADLAGVGLRS